MQQKLVSEGLRDSLEYMRTHGWTQNMLQQGDLVCSRGGMNFAFYGNVKGRILPLVNRVAAVEASIQAGALLRQAILAQHPEMQPHYDSCVIRDWTADNYVITSFNDYPGRTFEEVEVVFEKAIVIAEELGI